MTGKYVTQGKRAGRFMPGLLPVLAPVLLIGCTALLVACTREEPTDHPAKNSAAGHSEQELTARGGSASLEQSVGSPELSEDVRIAYLFAPCARSAPFFEDTSNLIKTLAQKLVNGERDPTRLAKIELAQSGTLAQRELESIVDASFDDPMRAALLSNVVDVLTRSREPFARELLLRLIGHQALVVRSAAVRGMRNHAEPQDYEALTAALQVCKTGQSQLECLLALAKADPMRLLRELVHWFDRGLNDGHWVALTRFYLEHYPQEFAGVFAGRWRDSSPGLAPFLASAAVHGAGVGEEGKEARAFLRASSEVEDVNVRLATVEALRLGGWWVELALFVNDSDTNVRLLAVSTLAEGAPGSVRIDALQGAVSDVELKVRQAALGGLVEVGFEPALADAVDAIGGAPAARHAALMALKRRMPEDSELAERVRTEIRGLLEGFEDGPWSVRSALFKAIGFVPGRESADLLLSFAEDEETLAAAAGQNMTAHALHRFLARQAGNAGLLARAFLVEKWQAENDPRRRMNLMEAAAFGQGEAASEFLLSALMDRRLEPEELVQAADALTRRGPARRVAPILKRVALRVEDPASRRALNCLLWRWYG